MIRHMVCYDARCMGLHMLFVSTLSIKVWVLSYDLVGLVNLGNKPWDVIFS